MKGPWCVYARTISLHAINSEKFGEEEYAIEFGIYNEKTDESKDVKILVHDHPDGRTKEACEKKIEEVKLKHSNALPTV